MPQNKESHLCTKNATRKFKEALLSLILRCKHRKPGPSFEVLQSMDSIWSKYHYNEYISLLYTEDKRGKNSHTRTGRGIHYGKIQ